MLYFFDGVRFSFFGMTRWRRGAICLCNYKKFMTQSFSQSATKLVIVGELVLSPIVLIEKHGREFLFQKQVLNANLSVGK